MVRVFVPVVPVFLVHCRTGKVDTGIPTETNAHAIPNTNRSPSPNPTDPTAVFFLFSASAYRLLSADWRIGATVRTIGSGQLADSRRYADALISCTVR